MVCAIQNLFNLSKLCEISQWNTEDISIFILMENSGLEIAASAVSISRTTAGAYRQWETEPDITSS